MRERVIAERSEHKGFKAKNLDIKPNIVDFSTPFSGI
jgi:hypothetical protein